MAKKQKKNKNRYINIKLWFINMLSEALNYSNVTLILFSRILTLLCFSL